MMDKSIIGKEVYIINFPKENFDNPTNVFDILFNKGKITIKKTKIIYMQEITYENQTVVSYCLDLPTDMIWYYERNKKYDDLIFTLEEAQEKVDLRIENKVKELKNIVNGDIKVKIVKE